MKGNLSYAKGVKSEIADIIPGKAHCLKASAAAIIYAVGELKDEDGVRVLELRTENDAAVRKCFTIVEKAFNIDTLLEEIYPPDAERVREMIKKSCCRKAFLREAFICAGSVSDPHGDYHLEFACRDAEFASFVADAARSFDIGAKTTERGRSTVVYLKDGEDIARLFNVIGAHKSLLEFEDLRILKEMRSGVNRRVNCDTANIRKSVNASAAQVERIRKLEESGMLDKLDEPLKEAARVRLSDPEATLSQLADMCEPPVSKSGMNHRLQKLLKLADEVK